MLGELLISHWNVVSP